MTLATLVVAVFGLFAGDQIIQTDMRTLLESPQSTTVKRAAAAPSFAYVSDHLSDANTVVATVPLGPGPIGVAITPDGAFAYVTVAGQNKVAVLSTVDNSVVKTIDVGPGIPVAVAITPDGAFAYISHAFPPFKLSVISTATNEVVDTIDSADSPALASGPWSLAITPDGALVYVALNNGPGGVAVIATATNSEVATVNTPNAAYVAITPDGAEAYVGTDGGVLVIATATNTVVAAIPLEINIQGIAITPDGAFAYVANSSGLNRGAVSVISTASHTVVDVVPAGLQPWGVAITPAAERGRGRAKVRLCHKGHVIQVAEPAVPAHLKHGDTFPPCS